MRRIAKNLVSLLASDLASRAAVFVLYILVARHLSAFELGQLSLGLTFFYIFQVTALSGMKTLITREIARDRSATPEVVTHAALIVLAMSALSTGLLGLTVAALGYQWETALVIMLLCSGLAPFALSALCEAVFQAWEQMWYIAAVNIAVNTLKVVAGVLLLTSGSSLLPLIGVLVLSQVATLVLNSAILARRITWGRLALSVPLARSLAAAAAPFLGIDIAIALSSSLSVILLSRIAGELEVGLFNAAAQLLVPIALICQSAALSVFPVMCRRYDGTRQSLQPIVEQMIALLLALTFPLTVGLWFLAEPTLVMLYGGSDFAESSTILRIVVWTIVFTVLTSMFGQVILASRRERATLRIVVVNGIVGLCAGVVLIWNFGVVGAAVSLLLVRLVDCLQHYVVAARLLDRIRVTRLIWKPALATSALGLFLSAAAPAPLALTVAAGGLIYVLVFAGLEVWSSGGVRQWRAKYASLWSGS
jgi:O-antigen/teichoic acid export membrane protein